MSQEAPGPFDIHEELARVAGELAENQRQLTRQLRDLRRREEQLEETARLREELIGMLAHELRNPVTVIYGYASIMQKHDLIPQEMKEGLVGASTTLKTRLDDMVSLARLNAGETIDVEPVSLGSLLTETVKSFSRGSSRELNLLLPSQALIVCAHEGYLRQVITNLISNADKYTPESRPIDLSVEPAERHAAVAIRDYGSGISEEDQERLFEPFFRSDSFSSLQPGMGIGLAVVQRLTRAMGGSVDLTSGAAGSTFRVTLQTIAASGSTEALPTEDPTP